MKTIVKLTTVTILLALVSVSIQPTARTATVRVTLVVLAALAGASLVTVMRRGVPEPPIADSRPRQRRKAAPPRRAQPLAVESLAVALRAGTSDHPHAQRGARPQLVAAVRAATDPDDAPPATLPTSVTGWDSLLDELEAR